MKTVLLGTFLGFMVFTGLALANLLEVKKAVEEALCRKLATAYANDPDSSTVTINRATTDLPGANLKSDCLARHTEKF